MANIEAFRKIIREEVRKVFQEELAGILKEAVMEKRSLSTITEDRRPKKPIIPGTLNTKPFKPIMAPNLGVGNPLNSLLAETAHHMASDDYQNLSFTSNDAPGFGFMQSTETPVVDTITDMMATARPSSNLDAIQINAVPDYTQLMSKLRANGDI
jgi:hypothetical protein